MYFVLPLTLAETRSLASNPAESSRTMPSTVRSSKSRSGAAVELSVASSTCASGFVVISTST